MTLLEMIGDISQKAVPQYTFEFETAKMMNVDADNITFPCIFFEEYNEGKYEIKHRIRKSTVIELYFMRVAQFHGDAIGRERLREQIEEEAIIPFIRAYNACGLFEPVSDWKFYPSTSRFDANEVSIMLRFTCVYNNAHCL